MNDYVLFFSRKKSKHENSIRQQLNGPMVRQSHGLLVQPLLQQVPNPVDDPNGFNRQFILSSERFAYYFDHVLRDDDLTSEVLAWVQATYPDQHLNQANLLHTLKMKWLRENLGKTIMTVQDWDIVMQNHQSRG